MTRATHTPRLFADTPCPAPALDLDAARETREAAIDAVGANADVDWREKAYAAVENLARSRRTFIVDDVWKLLAALGVEKPAEARAMGAVMRRAQADEIVERTATLVPSAQVQCHGNLRRVWKSLVYVERHPGEESCGSP